MNQQLRRLSMVVIVLFVSLIASASYIQFFQASALNADGRNTRTIYRELGRDRGPITVGDTSVALSAPSGDNFAYQRSYPQGPLYAFVTGYYPVYGMSTGLERSENAELNGTANSQFLKRIQDWFTGKQPTGAIVETTIDPAAQQAAYDAFGDQRGAAVAIDVKTGAILAMVSLPSYDPNVLATHDKAAFNDAFAALNADPTKPLVNRAIAGDTYPPGSVFKLVTASAALESGKYTPDTLIDSPTVLDLPGTSATIKNPGGAVCGDGTQATLTEALRVSCNTPFANIGMDLGADAMAEQAEKYGYDQNLNIPMRVTPSRFPQDPNDPQLAQSSMGQFDVRVTPLQVAMTTAAIANGGVEMTPYLVQTVRASDLTIVEQTKPQVFSTPISADTAEQLTQMMVNVVENGTGSRAQIDGVAVAGKTGTAETGTGGPPHAWFTSFAPADNPQVAVAVVVEEGGDRGESATGSSVAAPIAKAIMEAVLNK